MRDGKAVPVVGVGSGGVPTRRRPVDVVIEVMSPDDVFREVMAKADEYLAAGVRLVYVIDPSRELAMLFEKGKLSTLFGPNDAMIFPGVLPDLRIPVGPLFT